MGPLLDWGESIKLGERLNPRPIPNNKVRVLENGNTSNKAIYITLPRKAPSVNQKFACTENEHTWSRRIS